MILVCKGCEWHHLCLRQKVTAVVKWSMSPTSQKATISSEVVHAWTFSPPLYVICIPFDLSTIIYLPPSPSSPYCLWPSAKKKQCRIGGDYFNNDLVQISVFCDDACSVLFRHKASTNFVLDCGLKHNPCYCSRADILGTVGGPVLIMNCTVWFIS